MSTFAPSSAAGPPPGMPVRLSSNESPFGPSPRAVEAAAQAAARAQLYPDDQSVELREAIAAAEGADVDTVAVGTGSAALLLDLIGHECRDGGAVLAFEHAYLMYRVGARRADAAYLEAPDSGPATLAAPGYQRDVNALLDHLDDTVRLVLVDNPGNPTNAHLPGEALRTLVEEMPEHVTVLVDEAYHQFAVGQQGHATVDELALEHPRLLVMRTFSKAYALAGMRVGYLKGPAALIDELDAWRVRFNVSSPSQAAAVASLGDTAHLEFVVRSTIEGRRRMADGLRELEVPFSDGLGNFLTLELGEEATPVVDAYAERGIGVRPLRTYGMREQIRVTVGRPEEVDEFLETSSDVLAGVTSRG